ncbi:MAG: Mur ligase family protein, partial [Clostridium sp.]
FETSCIAVDMACDKLLTKELLRLQNLPVADGAKVYNVINLLKEGEYIGYPLVLKPQFGNQGKGIVLNICNEKELVCAYEQLKDNFKDLIVEKYYKGNDYRVCVIDYKIAAVSLRRPPLIVGDGRSTIMELINILNENPLRGEGHEKPLTRIKIDIELIQCLKDMNYNEKSIIKKGEKIFLRRNANLSTGGDAVDCTNIICDENIEICIRAAKTLGLDICGIDICVEDISKPMRGCGIIMEINAAPGLRMHLYPTSGEVRNVGDEIVNMLYKGNVKNIPVIAITGTNGKTTTTRVINHTLSKMGYMTGMTSTDGIYVDGKCIDKGDDTGAESAKSILLNKEVDIAVLETARGGIIKRGLAYDLADVAVITNIT